MSIAGGIEDGRGVGAGEAEVAPCEGGIWDMTAAGAGGFVGVMLSAEG